MIKITRYFPEDYSKTAKQFAEELIQNIDGDIVCGAVSVSGGNPLRWTSVTYSKAADPLPCYDDPFDPAWDAIPHKVTHYIFDACIKTEICATKRKEAPKECKLGSDRIKELRHLLSQLDVIENKIRDASILLETLKKDYNAEIHVSIGSSRLSTTVGSEKESIQKALERELRYLERERLSLHQKIFNV